MTSPYDLLNVCCVFMLLLEMLAFYKKSCVFARPLASKEKAHFLENIAVSSAFFYVWLRIGTCEYVAFCSAAPGPLEALEP